MGLKVKKTNIKIGNSTAITIPVGLDKGKESTLAVNRIGLIDFKGEIPEGVLLEFLETHIEPIFWKWYTNWKEEQAKALL